MTKGDGTGMMFISDGATDTTQFVYKTKVKVEAGKTYAFSVWAANILRNVVDPNADPNTAAYLGFVIDGKPLGAIQLPMDTLWHQFYQTWTAPAVLTSDTIVISIKDKNTVQFGNDFAFDDMVFAPLYTLSKKDTVKVPACIVCKVVNGGSLVPTKTAICQGEKISIAGDVPTQADNTTFTYTWERKSGSGALVAITGATDKDYAIDTLSKTTTFVRTAIGAQGCNDTSSVTITVYGKPVVTASVKNPAYCEGDTFILKGRNSATQLVMTYTWSQGTTSSTVLGTADTLSQKPAYQAAPYLYYFIGKSTASQGGCTDTASVNVSIQQAPSKSIVTRDSLQLCIADAVKRVSANQPTTGTGKWNILAGSSAGVGLQDPTLYNSTITGLDQSAEMLLAEWTISTGGVCADSRDTMTVIGQGIADPVVELGVSAETICEQSSVTFTAQPIQGAGDAPTYTLYDKDHSLISAEQSTTTFALSSVAQDLEYYVVMKSNSACRTRDLDSSLLVKVSVDKKVVKPTYASGDTIKTCDIKTTLEALSPTPQPATALGKWKWLTSSAGNPTISDTTVSPTQLENIPLNSQHEVYYVVSNGVCPKDSSKLVIWQMGEVSSAILRLNGGVYTDTALVLYDTLCIGTSYTFTPRFQPNNGIGEEAAWNWVANATGIVPGPLTATDYTFTPLAVGDAEVTYSISNPNIGGCAPNSVKVKLIVNAPPTVGNVTGRPFSCEDSSKTYRVDPSSVTSTLQPVTFQWSMGTNAAARTGQEFGDSTSYLFTSDMTGSIVTGDFTVTPTNVCGSGTPLSKVVDIRLKPRKFDAVTDTIEGARIICSSNEASRWRLLRPQTEATYYEWYWDNIKQSDTDTSIIIQQNQWQGKSSVPVQVTLANVCGVGTVPSASQTVMIQINQAQPLGVSLISSNALANGRVPFCQPEDVVDFAGIPTPNVGPDATYAFYKNGVLVQAFSVDSLYKAPQLSLNDGDLVKVVLLSQEGCFTNDSATATVQTEAYQYPDDSIYFNKLKMCENKDQSIVLSLKTDKNNDGSFTWYKNGALLSETGSIISLSRASESGEYSVKIGASICPDTGSKHNVSVKIYETANPFFVQNPVVINYQENISVPMPQVNTGLSHDSLLKEFYWSTSEWLQGSNTLQPTIHPLRESKDITYELTLVTGELGVFTCENSAKVRVINMIPLLIPNAFSPNDDGKNDVWVIEGIGGYPQSKIKVYNRWGNEMFSNADGYKVSWDGNRNGAPLPSGTYYYIIELKGSLDNTDHTETGSLTIVK